ncbi:DUF6308 family protein [Brachybacterium tyrofermentans]|uniref:DUF6308 family protein n=1 Tax=Brachybacterium tyrofermentans TaxID=47848 RepID=UPI003FD31FBD
MTTIDVPATVTSRAQERALEALGDDAACRAIKYFSVNSNYAGALFLGLEPNEPDRFTATDLFAVSSLSVSIPARGARCLLAEPVEQNRIAEALRLLPVGPLETVEDDVLEAMSDFHGKVKKALRPHGVKSSNRWVTASKLAARKRPHLFPVRDSLVATSLGLGELKTVAQEYAVFRHLMSHPEVSDRLDDLQEELEKRRTEKGLILENSHLRLLDVVLWTHAKGVECKK